MPGSKRKGARGSAPVEAFPSMIPPPGYERVLSHSALTVSLSVAPYPHRYVPLIAKPSRPIAG